MSVTRSLRFRVTLWSSLAVAAVLTAAAFGVVALLRQQMVSTLDRVIEGTLVELTSGGRNGRPNRPVGPDGPVWINIENSEFALQILDTNGELVTTSRVLSRLTEPLVGLDELIAYDGGGPFNARTDSDGHFRVRVSQIDRAGQSFFLVIALNQRDVDRATETLASSMLIAVPSLVLLLGLLTWTVTGSALNPVESIRREVDEISADQLHRRVRVPKSSYELESLATTMNAMLERLDASSETQRQFVDDASHELRSPIAGIRGLLEVNLAHPDNADWEETGAEMLDETLRMQRLVDDMMTLARGDSRRSRLRTELLDLDDLVLAEGARLKRETELEVDMSEVSAAQVTGESGALMRVLRNLTDNAARHAESKVWLSLGEYGGEVVLSVADDGPGVASEQVDRIFERFARLESARDRDSGGSGLGLAISRTIVLQHGGTIELDTSYSTGARFVVHLPAS